MSESNRSEAITVVTEDAVSKAERRLVWNDKNMRQTFANVVNVAATNEEVSVLFGTNRSWHAEVDEVEIDLTDRIILTPHAAKRLLVLLDRAMKTYEGRHGRVAVHPGAATEGGG